MTHIKRNVSIVMASFAFILIWVLLYYAIVEENVKMGSKVTLKTIFTPFTTLLLVMIIANLGEYVIEALLFDQYASSLVSTEILETIRTVCDCAGEYSYLTYGLLRADAIVKMIFPKFQPILKKLQRFAVPVAFLVEAGSRILAFVYATNILDNTILLVHYIVSAVNGLLIIFVDAVCLIAFIRFLRRIQEDVDSLDNRFIIISRYGIVSVIVCISALGFSIAYSFTQEETWSLIIYLHFSAIVLVLFLMKRALLEDRKTTNEAPSRRLESGEHSIIKRMTVTKEAKTMETSFTKKSHI
ncbi:hypothetical protein BCR33DRAFT_858429 [Rhizoclosmatium globosum]|uniref:Uncharacterized protein n=1 Tax=Rhizoclosmatium globosum TaxID=329046 RepID=A0A1Y2AZD4_9FUNG|nr:hypothetical protein BCR33DRAFT_858429 [Rhizoclosmatium globosum]|eukprot:ORY27597.1 hypothetical protein BCR33DRAFT_858429 [Rhizoclosmatium globosum]